MATFKPQNNGPPYSNMVIGTQAIDGSVIMFGTAKMGPGGLWLHPVSFSLYQM